VKIYIVCDLEGTAGVVDHHQQCQWDDKKEWYAPFLHQARRLATEELNAAVQGALDGGATEVWAWDGHGGFPGGIDYELLHPECQMVMAAGDGGPAGIDSSFDALMMVGLHGMRDAPWGRLAHSFHDGIIGMWVNDTKWGEIAANAWEAGRHGVPVAFLAGDRSAAEEVTALLGDVETVIVKRGLDKEPAFLKQSATLCLAPAKAREIIREGAERSLAKVGHLTPYEVPGPYTVRTEFKSEKYADWMMQNRPGLTRVNETTVQSVSDELMLAL
jgi:D-amino peptidase